MLVLSRQRDETIMIGDDVEITVVDIRGDKVRLGITAPRSIQVHRKEVYEAIKRENAEASQVQVDDLNHADQNLRRGNGQVVRAPGTGSTGTPGAKGKNATPRRHNRPEIEAKHKKVS